MAKKQPNYDRLTKASKRRLSATKTPEIKQTPRRTATGSRIPRTSPGSVTPVTRERSRDKLHSPGSSFTREKERTPSFTRSGSNQHHPAVTHLSKKWQHLWLLSMERLRRLQERLDRIAIVSRASSSFQPCRFLFDIQTLFLFSETSLGEVQPP